MGSSRDFCKAGALYAPLEQCPHLTRTEGVKQASLPASVWFKPRSFPRHVSIPNGRHERKARGPSHPELSLKGGAPDSRETWRGGVPWGQVSSPSGRNDESCPRGGLTGSSISRKADGDAPCRTAGYPAAPHPHATVGPAWLCRQRWMPFSYSVFDRAFLLNFIKFTSHIKHHATVLANFYNAS